MRFLRQLESLKNLQYPEFEIIVVNDGSTDETADILNAFSTEGSIRAIHLETNQGKAAAMRVGTLASKHEFIVCLDGDAILDPHALTWLIRHFDGPRVAAVTGNPRIRTRSTLAGADTGRRVFLHYRLDQTGTACLWARLHRVRRCHRFS